MACPVCNPMCGRCRPAQMRSIMCPECMTGHVLTKGDPIIYRCVSCGTLLPDAEGILCNRTQKICAMPCARAKAPAPEDAPLPCYWALR